MDDFLAEVYGTTKVASEDIEKTAEAAILDELEKVAEEAGINLDDMPDEDILDLVQNALQAKVDAEKTAAEAEVETVETVEDEPVDDDQQKLAEADFIGRVMAHSFYQELGEIGEAVEKTASEGEMTPKEYLNSVLTGQEKVAEDDEVVTRANEILEAATAAAEAGEVKESAAGEDDLNARALQLLADNDFDVKEIVGLLS